MYKKIGETFEFGNKIYKVVGSLDSNEPCEGCVFNSEDNLYNCDTLERGGKIPHCFGMKREDNMEVIFIEKWDDMV